jgi:hypothetical protein
VTNRPRAAPTAGVQGTRPKATNAAPAVRMMIPGGIANGNATPAAQRMAMPTAPDQASDGRGPCLGPDVRSRHRLASYAWSNAYSFNHLADGAVRRGLWSGLRDTQIRVRSPAAGGVAGREDVGEDPEGEGGADQEQAVGEALVQAEVRVTTRPPVVAARTVSSAWWSSPAIRLRSRPSANRRILSDRRPCSLVRTGPTPSLPWSVVDWLAGAPSAVASLSTPWAATTSPRQAAPSATSTPAGLLDFPWSTAWWRGV